jgi:micrococcal nuclease
MAREMRLPVVPPPDLVMRGQCWVIDGDTIVIDTRHIRLAGIDAPELDHPWGQKAKWALVALCKGQVVTARLKPELSYDRLVAECFLPDGRDLAAELVKAGLALDWPKFSGGKYRSLEPEDARKKLWRANLRQSGLMWPAHDMVPAAERPVVPLSQLQPRPTPPPVRHRQTHYRLGWMFAAGFLVVLVGCQFVGGEADLNKPYRAVEAAPALASFEVTAHVLNVRAKPAAGAAIIAQISQGTLVTPERMTGRWYGIALPDRRTGWVYGEFLNPVAQ